MIGQNSINTMNIPEIFSVFMVFLVLVFCSLILAMAICGAGEIHTRACVKFRGDPCARLYFARHTISTAKIRD